MVNLYNKTTKKIVTEGKQNRDRIFDYIYDNRHIGTRSKDIIKQTHLSREAVHNNLLILINEKRINKKNHRYYPEISIRNEFSVFGDSMRDGFYKIIDREMIESAPDADCSPDLGKYPRLKLHQKIMVDFPEKILTRSDFENASFIDSPMYLMKMMLGPVTSEKYCRTNFGTKESLEKCLFEFSNRIGAYITYIFLQSLHPLQDSKVDDKDRNELCKIMIEKAISIEDLFMFFRSLIIQLGLTDSTSDPDEHEKLSELSESNFKTISKGLQNVYSNLYIGFENWWSHITRNTLALDVAFAATSTCMHEWKKIEVFKYGSCDYCKKCQRYLCR